MKPDSAPERDFPFYAGAPVALSPGRWLLVVAGCAAGFATLVGFLRTDPTRWDNLLAAGLFVVLPLTGLALASGGAWTVIFRRPTRRDLTIALLAAPAALATSALVALLLTRFSVTAANPGVERLVHLPADGRLAFFAATAPQLLGEELVTILPFLALLTLLHGAFGLRRRWALIGAWVVSALIFGALHLPTYDWNLAQALLVIGSSRLVLTIPYLMSKTIWASYIAHLTLDWSLFLAVLLVSSLR